MSSSSACTVEHGFGEPIAQRGQWVHFVVKKEKNHFGILSSHRTPGS